jgi:hypothetical protein
LADFQKPKSDFDREMVILENEMRRLEAEFNMFFAGRLPRPPWETKARVAALVKKTDNSYIRNTADRFRFESLQNRHSKFLELVDRQMTNRELGRPMLGRKAAPAQETAKKEEKGKEQGAPTNDEHKTVEVKPLVGKKDDARAHEQAADKRAAAADQAEVRFKRDQALEAERVKQLHAQLASAKRQAGEKEVPMDRLEKLVKAQVDKFKSEGKDVTFKVAVKDGKVSLTATPVKDE